MNKWLGMGRLTKDPDVRYSQSENSQAIARFTVAVDRRRTNSDGTREADFIPCVAFGRTAEFCEKHIKQGTRVCVEAHVQTGSYTNKDGNKVYTTEFLIDSIEFAESKSSQNAQNGREGGHGSQPNNYTPRQGNGNYGNSDHFKKQSQPAQRDTGYYDGFLSIPNDVDSDMLPFN